MCSYLELLICILLVFFFFFNDTATTEIYTLSLHDALPILVTPANGFCNFQCWYDMAIRVSPVNPSLVFVGGAAGRSAVPDRKSTRLNSSHLVISYAVFCLKKKKTSSSTATNIPCLLTYSVP